MKSFLVDRVLKQLGSDLRDARRRRLLSTEDMATRIGISRPTLQRLEKGDPKVAMGTYAAALMVFEKLDKLEQLFDDDRAAIAYLESIKIPSRIKSSVTAMRKKMDKDKKQ